MKKLRTVIKTNLTEQKERLFDSMIKSPSNMWQKYARILERKFDSWNIRQKTEDVNVTKALTLAELARKAEESTQSLPNVQTEALTHENNHNTK